MKQYKNTTRWLIIIVLSSLPTTVFAQPNLLPPCIHSGNCGLCDMVDVIGRIFEFLLWGLGLAVFLFFIYGAYTLLYSKGQAEAVQKGREIITNTLIGGLVVFLAWQLVNFILFVLGSQVPGTFPASSGEPNQKEFYLFKTNPWSYICEGNTVPPGTEGCFSRGDGTPCPLTTQKKSASEGESGVVWEVKEGWGYCSKGVCTQGDACAYLASTYKEYFGSEGGRSNIQRYSCQSDKKSGDTAGTSKPVGNYYTVQWDCLEEEHLCTNEKQKCCGEVKLPGENPYPTSK